jgi:hypothetical protein
LATEKVVKYDWTEPMLRPYFGWSEDSDMPSRYVHLKMMNHRNRILRDAGVDALGMPVAQGTAMSPEQMMTLAMKQMMDKMARDFAKP